MGGLGRFNLQLARAGSSGLASSTVAWKLQSATGSSGLARIGHNIRRIRRALKRQSAIGSSGLERIGLEHCGLEASNCDWLERARPDWPENPKDTLGIEASKCNPLERARVKHERRGRTRKSEVCEGPESSEGSEAPYRNIVLDYGRTAIVL